MKKIVLFALMAGFATSCSSQNRSKQDLAQNDPKLKVEKPKGNWTVNKEMDENGNIIKYDSIYSYSSTDDLKGLNATELDSVMTGFTQRFESHSFSGADGLPPGFFGEGSAFSDDMFKEFFGDDKGNGSEMMKKLLEHMEAMRSQMQQDDAIIPAIPKKDNKSNKDSSE